MSDKPIEELVNEARRVYFKEWRAKNKDKVRRSNQKFWQKRAEKMLAENTQNDDNN